MTALIQFLPFAGLDLGHGLDCPGHENYSVGIDLPKTHELRMPTEITS